MCSFNLKLYINILYTDFFSVPPHFAFILIKRINLRAAFAVFCPAARFALHANARQLYLAKTVWGGGVGGVVSC